MALETFGSIIKEERVRNYERGIMPGTLVLENLGMFPGYYGANLPNAGDPDSIFLVMTQKESTEKILRITHNIKKFSNIDFRGASATICINNNDLYAIRIRKLTDLNHLTEIQEHYRDAGISFAKTKQIEETAVIKIKKVFKVDDYTDKILVNEYSDMYYFKVNEQLTFSQFRKVVLQVRNNVTISAFDAALGVLYAHNILDVVRIYSTSLTKDELEKLHEKFEEIIAKAVK